MKVCFIIQHPAHVHYFKNLIFSVSAKNKVYTYVIEKDVNISLLNSYGIKHKIIGKSSSSMMSKLFYTFASTINLIKYFFEIQPNVVLATHSPIPTVAAYIANRKIISFTDTEHATLSHKIADFCTNILFTPTCYIKNNGTKQKRINSYFELMYLHPNYYKPEEKIEQYIDIKTKYVVMRFISWGAVHDIGHHGISLEIKKKAVTLLSRFARVYISSEDILPPELEKYRLKVPPSIMHDVLYHASLYFGESGTMATEAAILGTPSVRISSLAKLLGNSIELKDKYKLLYYYDEGVEGLAKCEEILMDNESKNKWKKRSRIMLKDKIDITKRITDEILREKNYE